MSAKCPLLVVVIVLMASCSTSRVAPSVQPEIQNAKNIILMVGDGMGLTQVSAGIYSNNNWANIESFEVIGLHKSYSSDKLVTDSAAGATAFACGQKTYNGAIAVDQDTIPLPTILEEAEQRGLATGLISTSSITHATPASFIAHNKSRQNYEEIALDFMNTEIDFFIGGGKNYFANREDELDLIDQLRSSGYQVEDFIDKSIDEVYPDSSVNFVYFTSNGEPLRKVQDRDYLNSAVKKSLDHLSRHSTEGFFLMIEGSQIDWGGHANELDYVITEFLDFDEAIGTVLDWAKNDQETLVVVTADHETGGLAIQPESKMNEIVGAFTSDYHTGSMIPVYAIGPRSELFSGIYENTHIYHQMREAFGWNTVVINEVND